MIPGSNAAALVAAAIQRPQADVFRLGPVQAAMSFGVFDVPFHRQAPIQQIPRTGRHHAPQFLVIEMISPAPADAGRNLIEENLHQGLQFWQNLFAEEIRANKPNAAVDVIAHTSRRNDTPRLRIRRADSADRKSVPPVDVGHRQAGALDSRKKGDIGHLFRSRVGTNQLQEIDIGINQPIHPHARFVAFGNSPTVIVDFFQWAFVTIVGHGGILLYRFFRNRPIC
jgi:hypothetical protein